MGFDTDMFVNPVDDNLRCTICFSVYDRPCTVCENGHVYCKPCIAAWEGNTGNQQNKKCPDCRGVMPQVKVLNQPLQRIVLNLQVACTKGKNETDKDGDQQPKRARDHHTC